jgi:ABC-type cobalamin transport system ATPase subunit
MNQVKKQVSTAVNAPHIWHVVGSNPARRLGTLNIFAGLDFKSNVTTDYSRIRPYSPLVTILHVPAEAT